jgi:hypothetical protein
VPLCRGHHREAHHCDNEVAWWNGWVSIQRSRLVRCG